MNMFSKTLWDKKQKLAAKTDLRYYGDGGTIHTTNQLDVETNHGVVVGVWFRCQFLPFLQTEVDNTRATEMGNLYNKTKYELHGVEIRDIK